MKTSLQLIIMFIVGMFLFVKFDITGRGNPLGILIPVLVVVLIELILLKIKRHKNKTK